MPKILVIPEFLNEKAAQLENCRVAQEEIINNVEMLIDNLAEGWRGAALKAFQAAFYARRRTYAQFAPDLIKFSQFLTRYAQTMEDIDLRAAGKVESASTAV